MAMPSSSRAMSSVGPLPIAGLPQSASQGPDLSGLAASQNQWNEEDGVKRGVSGRWGTVEESPLNALNHCGIKACLRNQAYLGRTGPTPFPPLALLPGIAFPGNLPTGPTADARFSSATSSVTKVLFQ